MANFTDRLYEALQPFANIDDNGHLYIMCSAVGAMFQPVEDLSADTDDGEPGWSVILDVNRIPAPLLGYLAQFVGVRLKSGLTDDQQRARVAGTGGFQRGRPASIIAAAQQHLTGTQTVYLKERDGSAWRFTVTTQVSETPDPEQTLQDLLEQKPGPDILLYENLAGQDFEQVRDGFATFGAARSAYATFEDMRDDTGYGAVRAAVAIHTSFAATLSGTGTTGSVALHGSAAIHSTTTGLLIPTDRMTGAV